MDEDGGVFPGRRLQAELCIRRLGVVGEGDGAGQLAIIQHLLVVLSQVDVTLGLKLESALQSGEKRGRRQRRCQRLLEKKKLSIRGREKHECVRVYKLNTQNGVCIIAA